MSTRAPTWPRRRRLIADSKAFDNSILCTNESAVIAHAAIAKRLAEELKRQGCHMLSEEERDRLAEHLFPTAQVQRLARRQIGGDHRRKRRHPRAARHARASRAARADRRRLPAEPRKALPGARLLRGRRRREAALTACRAMVRRQGAGHSAAIHAGDPGDHPALRGGDERAPDRGQCRLLDGRGRVRHVSRAHHDDRHRLFRALVGRRECRAAASRAVDESRLRQGRAVRRFRGAERCPSRRRGRACRRATSTIPSTGSAAGPPPIAAPRAAGRKPRRSTI